LALGTVIQAREIGVSKDDLQPLKPKKPKHAPHGKAQANSAQVA
jgi:hypothetical protein